MRALPVIAILLTLSLSITAWGCGLTGAKPPYIPHQATGGFADCRGCHASGVQGAPVPDHIKKDDCGKCHKLKAPDGQE